MIEQTFIPENKLEEILIKYSADKSYKLEFYSIFLDSEIYALINEKSPQQEKMFIATEDTKINFIAIHIREKDCLPIFSSLRRARVYLENRNLMCIRINSKSLLQSIDPRLTVMLNLKSPYGKEFTPEEVHYLLHDFSPKQE